MAPGFFCTFCETVLFVSLIKDWGPEMVSVPPKIYFSNVVRVAISPDGKILASGSNDTTIKLWNIRARKLLRTFAEHTDGVRSVAFSSDRRTLASGSNDTTIKLWNLDTGKLLRTLKEHSKPVTSVAFSPDGRTLASGSYDTTIKIWRKK